MVGDVFGFNALQIGLTQIDFLENNRIPLKLRIGEQGDALDLVCDLPELPFASNSIDLIVLAHGLEFHEHPHHLLREVERVLMPEGKLVVASFNPFSLWGLRRRLPSAAPDGPWEGRFISLPRLKDWLTLLNMEIDRGKFGCYAPPFRRSEWLARFGWMEKAGDRWWPVAAGVYLVRAVKRVHGMTLIKPNWRTSPARRRVLTTAVRKTGAHD